MNSTIVALAIIASVGVLLAFVIAEPIAYAVPQKANQGQCIKRDFFTNQECRNQFQNNP